MTMVRKICAFLCRLFSQPEPSRAWSAGYEAFTRDGSTNPYAPGTTEYRDWNDGYAEALLLENHW